MTLYILSVIFMTCNIHCYCAFVPVIGGGDDAVIKDFPHSVALSIKCQKTHNIDYWRCGGSILNQRLILTAAHCLHNCLPSTSIYVNMGDEHRNKGYKTKAFKFILHKQFVMDDVLNDIALVFTKEALPLNEEMQRVAIMKEPPYNFSDYAVLAGWGLVNEDDGEESDHMQFTSQKLVSWKECKRQIDELPPGVICGVSSTGYIAEGDSGSALIFKDYIQIGVVSFKVPSVSTYLSAYTDTSYFFDWIIQTAASLQCQIM